VDAGTGGGEQQRRHTGSLGWGRDDPDELRIDFDSANLPQSIVSLFIGSGVLFGT